jgi:hypothetical protein
MEEWGIVGRVGCVGMETRGQTACTHEFSRSSTSPVRVSSLWRDFLAVS